VAVGDLAAAAAAAVETEAGWAGLKNHPPARKPRFPCQPG
jgi:hypothetical protein